MARTKPWEVSDDMWERVCPLIPPAPSHAKGGRRRMDDRQAFEAIVYVLRTGMQWNALPREVGASSTVHDRFQQWERAGFFKALWQAGLSVYDELVGIQWEWQAADGVMTKAPFGHAATGATPTDRGKKGTKRSLLTDGAGIPLAMVIDGANRHDVRTAVRDPGWHRHCPFRAAPSSGLSISVWTRAMMGHQHTRRSRLATTSHLFAAVERRNRRKSLPLAIGRDAG
jgi:transposase